MQEPVFRDIYQPFSNKKLMQSVTDRLAFKFRLCWKIKTLNSHYINLQSLHEMAQKAAESNEAKLQQSSVTTGQEKLIKS